MTIYLFLIHSEQSEYDTLVLEKKDHEILHIYIPFWKPKAKASCFCEAGGYQLVKKPTVAKYLQAQKAFL